MKRKRITPTKKSAVEKLSGVLNLKNAKVDYLKEKYGL